MYVSTLHTHVSNYACMCIQSVYAYNKHILRDSLREWNREPHCHEAALKHRTIEFRFYSTLSLFKFDLRTDACARKRLLRIT